ncbi:MAG: MurR/RpiR family transcriptional regulator, partial [Anaerorhabdus sp.]
MKLEELIEQHYDLLNENDLYIWQYIYHHKLECQKMSIQELAHTCNVSHTSIIRFAKKIGLDGYSELKVHIKWSLERKDNFNNKMIQQISKELKDSVDMMGTKDFDEVLSCIDQASRIFVYTTGDVQYHVAQELKREFIYQRKIMHVIEGSSELDTVLNRVNKDDVFFIISLSGDNETAVTLVKYLKKMHITTIGIASDNGNLLSKYCDKYIGFQITHFAAGAFDKLYCCTTQFFIVVNMLFLRYLEYCSLKD